MAWGIQTVYLPRENLGFLEEWLQYHVLLGAEYFYLYDNTGSETLKLGNSLASTGKNKYGIKFDFSLSDGQIEEMEAEILKKYPVTKVKWQPKEDGKIVHGHVAACDHFSESANVDWCAFIDIDEFLYSPYKIAELLKGEAIKILQKKFEDRHSYSTALEITKTFSIDTKRWAPKLIINMKHYVKGGVSIHDLNVRSFRRPAPQDFDALRFNHYNHNSRGHDWLLENCKWLDSSWRPVKFEDVFTERYELLRDRWRDLVAQQA
jgi:hypothetical protein